MQQTDDPYKESRKVLRGMIGIFLLGIFIWVGKDMYGTYITWNMTEAYSIGTYHNYKRVAVKDFYHYYSFPYQNKKIEGSTSNRSYPKIGDRYIVRFWREKPEWSETLEDYKVTDSTLVAPPNGWDSIPIIR